MIASALTCATVEVRGHRPAPSRSPQTAASAPDWPEQIEKVLAGLDSQGVPLRQIETAPWDPGVVLDRRQRRVVSDVQEQGRADAALLPSAPNGLTSSLIPSTRPWTKRRWHRLRYSAELPMPPASRMSIAVSALTATAYRRCEAAVHGLVDQAPLSIRAIDLLV